MSTESSRPKRWAVYHHPKDPINETTARCLIVDEFSVDEYDSLELIVAPSDY